MDQSSRTMQNIILPHVILPQEFITLLKSNLSVTSSPAPVFDLIRPNVALFSILEKAFKEFDDGRGVEKTMIALGWANFRERMASIYVYKTIYGNYPQKTNMELVEEIKELESKFVDHSVHSISRVFLLGFYLKLANIQNQQRGMNQFFEIKVPDDVVRVLKITQGRSEKIDWLILTTMHFLNALGEKMLLNYLASGKKYDELYRLLTPEQQKNMMNNFLAYGASIQEKDIFIYDKI